MRAKPLPREFYNRPAPAVARDLLGKTMIHISSEGPCGGIIVEAEAYLGKDDPACHASRGRTPRCATMFGPPGYAYVYFTYGNHYCFNAVCRAEGVGEAVLIRALEPTVGIDLMRKRRKRHELKDLCSGPGKICQALRIDKSLDASDLSGGSPLLICEGETIPRRRIVVTSRIGIREAADLALRFYVKNSEFVSKK